MAKADAVVTSLVTRNVEVPAAIAKAVRRRVLATTTVGGARTAGSCTSGRTSGECL